jgi:hypothetical protein
VVLLNVATKSAAYRQSGNNLAVFLTHRLICSIVFAGADTQNTQHRLRQSLICSSALTKVNTIAELSTQRPFQHRYSFRSVRLRFLRGSTESVRAEMRLILILC